MNKYVNLIAAVFILGVVDQIHGREVIAEFSRCGEVEHVSMPLFMFPCDIREGDFFYFANIDGVFELRCGEPPE